MTLDLILERDLFIGSMEEDSSISTIDVECWIEHGSDENDAAFTKMV